MPVAGYHIGDAFVQIVASFDGVQEDVAREFSKIKDVRVPVQADVDSRQFNDAVERAAKESEKGAWVTVDVTGDTTKFTEDVAKGVAEAGRTSAVVNIDGDATPLEAKLAAIRATADAKIVKIDGDITSFEAKKKALLAAGEAKIIPIKAEVHDYEAKIAELVMAPEDSTIDVQAKVDEYLAKIDELKRRQETITLALNADATKLDEQIKAKQAERHAIEVKVNADTVLYDAKMILAQAAADDLDRKTIKPKVSVDTSAFTSSMFTARTQAQAVFAAVVIGAPLAGSALISGLGLGFITVALLAEKSNAQIKASFKGLQQDIVATARAGADQLVPVLVGAINQIDATVQKLGPDIARAMSFAGPDITALTRGIDGLALNAMPGLVTAMQNSLPVFQGLATFLGLVGTAVGNAFTSMSQHSSAYGEALVTLGQLFNTVLTAVVTLVNQFAEVWATAAGPIVAAIGKIFSAVTSLTSGAFPILAVALKAVAETVQAVLTVLGPFEPLLGAVGAAALVAFGAFKLAALVTTGVNALASGIVSFGAAAQAGAAKAAVFGTELAALEIAESGAATAAISLGASTAAAASTIGASLRALAGPIGIVLSVGIAAVGLVSAFSGAGGAADSLSGRMDGLTTALEKTHGAFTQAGIDALKADPDFKKAADSLHEFGVSTNDLATAVSQGGPALAALRKRIQDVIDAHPETMGQAAKDANSGISLLSGGAKNLSSGLDSTGQSAQAALKSLDSLAGEVGQSTAAANASAASNDKAAAAVANSSQFQLAAAGIAKSLGLGLGDVTLGFQSIIPAAGGTNATVSAVAEQFGKLGLAVNQAATAMSDHFVKADDAVAQAQQAVAAANRSYQKSIEGVADSQHSLQQAQQGVVTARQGEANAVHSLAQANQTLQDSYAGVVVAENTLTRAHNDERAAQVALNKAREQAVQDLKDLHLQLQDQTVSEEQARVSLFDAQTAAAAVGVTPGNAASVADQQVTAANEAQIKAAIALVSAQNGVNDSLNTGAKLRKQVSQADAAGVAGSSVVIAAQKTLLSAQDQVTSATDALAKAHQAVSTAAWGVQQADQAVAAAHRGVAEASYALNKAHLAVRDAQVQESIAGDNLRLANDRLRDAQDAASRSLDANTKAGQTNIASIYTLWDALQKTGLPAQEQYQRAVDDVASAFGISKQAAQDLLTQLGLFAPVNIPVNIIWPPGVTITTAGGITHLDLPANYTPGGPAGTGPVQVTTGNAGYTHNRASGGLVIGPGGPLSDSIPAMLSNGEYVLTAAAAAKYASILPKMNALALAGGGPVAPTFPSRRLAGGGPVLPLATAEGVSGTMSALSQPISATGVPLTTEQIAALIVATKALTDAVAALQNTSNSLTAAGLAPLVAEITTAAIPALALLEQHAGVNSVQAILALGAQLPPLRDGFNATTSTVLSDWSTMTASAQTSVAHQRAALVDLENGLGTARQAFTETANWAVAEFGRTWDPAARSPMHAVLDLGINQGLVAGWNNLNDQFAFGKPVVPVPVPFAEGGQVPGVGDGDTVPAMLTPGEYIFSKPAVAAMGGIDEIDRLHALAARGGDAARFAVGGPVLERMSGGANYQLPMAQTIAAQFPATQRITGYRPGSSNAGHPDMHSMGKATDIYADVGLMTTIAKWIFNRYPTSTELIHGNPNPKDNLQTNLMNKLGHTGYWPYPRDLPNHYNHVHWGLEDIAILGLPPGAGGGGATAIDVGKVVGDAFSQTLANLDTVDRSWPGNVAAQRAGGAARQAVDKAVALATDKLNALNSIAVGGSGPAIGGAVKDYQDYARSQFPRFGWGPEQFAPLVSLWNKESRWDPLIANKGSGAYGIPQSLPGDKMATGAGGPDWRTNPSTQINWGEDYIHGRYGTPAAAWAHETAYNWYDDGGWLPPGLSVSDNHTGKPEAILSSQQWATLSSLAGRSLTPTRPDVTVYAKTDASPDHIAHVVDRHLALGTRL